MSRKDNTTYRDTRRCANCHWVDFRDFGSVRGHYCNLHEHRCCKTKVCNDHTSEDEYRRMTEWFPDSPELQALLEVCDTVILTQEI